METTEKIPITYEHLQIMREKYNCQGLSDDNIISALLYWDNVQDKKYHTVLEYICFPNFQCVLDHHKNK